MSAPVTAAIDVEAERAEYEEAFKDRWWPWAFKKRNGEGYELADMQDSWRGWLAAKRAALAQPAPAAPRVADERELIEAAEALIHRWDSTAWKDVPHTAVFIERLRAALPEAPPVPQQNGGGDADQA